MANQGEEVLVTVDGKTTSVVLDREAELMLGAVREPGWICHTGFSDYFLAWNGKLYLLTDADIFGSAIGEAPEWRELLEATAQALSPETNYGAW